MGDSFKHVHDKWNTIWMVLDGGLTLLTKEWLAGWLKGVNCTGKGTAWAACC